MSRYPRYYSLVPLAIAGAILLGLLLGHWVLSKMPPMEVLVVIMPD